MNIYVKFSQELGTDLGPNFSISTNIGSITPSSVTRTELLAGKLFDISDDLASSITITSSGTCTNSVSLSIDKDSATCYADSAQNYQPGNSRPTDEEGGIAPFRTETLDSNEINNLLYADDGGQFELGIFGKNIIFFIEFTSFNSDGSFIRIGSASTDGFGNGQFDALFSSSQEVEMEILFPDVSVAYKIKGNSSSGFSVEEWSTSDLISSGY